MSLSNGYVRIERVKGSAPYYAFGVVNNGGQPGTGTGDGAFIAGSRSSYVPELAISGGSFWYCFGNYDWDLTITNARPNTPIRLFGDSAGLPGGIVLPDKAKTDYQGNYSAKGQISSSAGKFNLTVDVGGYRSNTVAIEIPTLDTCNE